MISLLQLLQLSLGAHIAGLAGKHVQMASSSIGMIACIIGLDPASYGFHLEKPEKRLANTDADYVQVIHTDINKFGMPYVTGHGEFGKKEFVSFLILSYCTIPFFSADFYPNGGKEV